MFTKLPNVSARRILFICVICSAFTACSEVGNDSPSQNDSLAVVPVGPGTKPDVITPPRTPQSRPDATKDSTTATDQ